MPTIKIGKVRGSHKKGYDETLPYDVLDTVIADGELYQALEDVPANCPPPISPSYWTRIGLRGEPGLPGPPGPPGESGGQPPISDSVTSPDSGVYASSKAVKTAYDKGVEGVEAAAAVAEMATDLIAATVNDIPDATPTERGFMPTGGLPGQVLQISADGKSLVWVTLPSGTPSRIIAEWTDAIEDIPSGWALCDGKNGTPDLRGKFIVGAGGAYAPGATGGAASATVTVTVGATTLSTAQMPSHSHSGVMLSSGSLGWSSGDGMGYGNTANAGGGGSHTHSGSSGSVATLPPFYALCYIMKL